jgi:C4-dicarboxylate-specific signal transduction histidine kinase
MKQPDAIRHLHTRARRLRFKPTDALAHASRVATLGKMTGSIAHEVNQPLAGIVTNDEATLR